MAETTLQQAKALLLNCLCVRTHLNLSFARIQRMGHASSGRAAPVLDQAKRYYTECLRATEALAAAGHPPVTRPHCVAWYGFMST